MGQCIAKTQDGTPCQIPARAGQQYCHVHRRQRSWRQIISFSVLGAAILGLLSLAADITGLLGFISKLLSTEQPAIMRITYPRDGTELSQRFVDVHGIWESKPEEGQDLWLYVYDRSVNRYYLTSIATLNDGTWRSNQAYIGAADEDGSEYKIGVMTLPSSESRKLDSGFIELLELPDGAIKLREITIFRRPVPTQTP